MMTVLHNIFVRPSLHALVNYALTLALALATASCSAAETVVAGQPEPAQACSAALGRANSGQNPGFGQLIELLSWNIQKAQNPGWDTDLRSIGSDRKLLLIQEASAESMIASALPHRLYQAFAAGYTTKSQTTGVLTLSTVEPTLQCNLTAWEPWLGTPKATNITEYPLAGRSERLLVINLHAVNFTVGLEDYIGQIEAISPLIRAHQGPLLIAGDFNTWSETRRAYLADFMTRRQLVAVSFAPDQRTTFWNLPLDHLYLRGLHASEARVVPLDSSDHNPLLVTLEISD